MNQAEEHKKAHILAIEDCIKAKKLLAGFGIKEHESVFTMPEYIFDLYYDCDIETLHIEHESLCAQANEYVRTLHFMSQQSMEENNRIFRELSEDEQDTEE